MTEAEILARLDLPTEQAYESNAILTAFEDRINSLTQRVDQSDNRHERRIYKSELKDFQAIKPHVELFVARLRFSEFLERSEELLNAEKIKAAAVAWREAGKILDGGNLDASNSLKLSELWAEIEQQAELKGLTVSKVEEPSPSQSFGNETRGTGCAESLPIYEDASATEPAEPFSAFADKEEIAENSAGLLETPWAESANTPAQIEDPLPGNLDPQPTQEDMLPESPPLVQLPELELYGRPPLFTLRGPEGELLHVVAREEVTFGRSPDADIVVRAYAPNDEEEFERVSFKISRLHFTISRQPNEVYLYSGSFANGRRTIAPNGILADGVEITDLQLFRSGTRSFRVLRHGLAENPPSWDIVLKMQVPADLAPACDATIPTGPQGLLLKRMDGKCEDVLLLWGAVDLQQLDLCEPKLFLMAYNSGFYVSDGESWSPVKSGMRFGRNWEIISYGAIERH